MKWSLGLKGYQAIFMARNGTAWREMNRHYINDIRRKHPLPVGSDQPWILRILGIGPSTAENWTHGEYGVNQVEPTLMVEYLAFSHLHVFRSIAFLLLNIPFHFLSWCLSFERYSQAVSTSNYQLLFQRNRAPLDVWDIHFSLARHFTWRVAGLW